MKTIKESFIEFFKNEETKKEMKLMIRPFFDLIYNEMYVYILLICIYNIVLVFILLVILYILICIWYRDMNYLHIYPIMGQNTADINMGMSWTDLHKKNI